MDVRHPLPHRFYQHRFKQVDERRAGHLGFQLVLVDASTVLVKVRPEVNRHLPVLHQVHVLVSLPT